MIVWYGLQTLESITKPALLNYINPNSIINYTSCKE